MSRGARGGAKASPQKKDKRAKSAVHVKKRFSPLAEETSNEDARRRTLQALEHLGTQRLSKEQGGYNLESWLRGLRTLLDDFEEKVGEGALTDNYRRIRGEVEGEFASVEGAGKVEAEIEAIRREESDIHSRLKEEGERISSRLSAIGGERTSKGRDLVEEKERLRELNEERRRASFVSKLFGRSGAAVEPREAKVGALEAELKALEAEAANLQMLRKGLDGAKEAAGGVYEDLWKRLEALERKMVELDAAREVRVQLLDERRQAAALLTDVITKLSLEEPQD